MRQRSRDIAKYAEQQGFLVSTTRRGHLKFSRPGCRTVFTSGSPSDVRVLKNTKAEIRRSLRGR